MALQIPDKGMQPLSKQVEDYFRTNHPDYYLTHQVFELVLFLFQCQRRPLEELCTVLPDFSSYTGAACSGFKQ
jgi:hypothetical protein